MGHAILWGAPLLALTACSDLSGLTGSDGSPTPLDESEAGAPDAAATPTAGDAANDGGDDSLEVGLVARFPFDEGTGDTTADVSGHGHPGALRNGARWVPGKFGNALALDGASQYVEVLTTDELTFGQGPFTVAARIQLTTVDGSVPFGAIVSRGIVGACCNSAGYPGYLLGAAPGGYGLKVESDAAGINSVWASASPPPPGIWMHIAGVRRSNSVELYYNGMRAATSALPAGYSITVQDSLQIGARPAFTPSGVDTCFVGMIDELRIYARDLSPTELTHLAHLAL